ncbi:MAG TPA: LamG-like jellyroll fold domain-containing protein, partial [Gemmatimonadaceae bacterium]|nr:LamG-like jellyroll fold domain-containing protein [Gemmatimonadaceae bacterium]
MQSLQRRKGLAVVALAACAVSVFACSDVAGPNRVGADPMAEPRTALSPQAPGLVAAYAFDETSGTAVADGSGNGNAGTFGSAVTRTTSGKFGGALAFTGGYVTIPDAATLDLTTAATIEAWVNPSVVASGWSTAVQKEQAGDYVYSLYASAPGMPSGEINVGTAQAGERIALGPSALPANTWSHLASTYDGSILRLYVNGLLVASKATTGPITVSTGALRIGGNAVWGEYFRGQIDEVRIYARPLSGAEIQADMSAPIGSASVPDLTPPTVAITSPTPAQTYVTDATQLTIGGTASDNVGVTQVAWSNSLGGAGTAVGTSTWSVAGIALQPGSNTITVTARDAANNVSSATLTVTRAGPKPGLVAAFSFDETSGVSAIDASGNGNTGTLGGGVTRVTTGRFGSALTFSKSYVSVADAPSLDLSSGMTVEAWIFPTVAPSTWATAVLKEQPGDYVYALYGSAPTQPSAELNVGTSQAGERIAGGPSQAPINTWTHIASTYDGSSIRLYVNGVQAASIPATGSIAMSTGALRIGGNAVWGEYFTGRIDEVRIYNRALAASEVQSDMTTPITGSVSGSTPTADAVAPTAAITAPTTAATYTTASSTVNLAGTASDNVGVTQVSWANDRGGSGVATGTTSWSVSGVALQAGTNILTVTARDAANNAASSRVTITTTTATASAASLAIVTQPATAATSGVPLATQPAVQLRDASGAVVAQSGVGVLAAIASGGGTLGGTTTVVTDASGVARFTNLSITGTTGSRTLRFTVPSIATIAGVTSTAIAVTASSSGGSDEPVFSATTGTVIIQDNFDSYTSVTAMGATPMGTAPRIAPNPSPILVSRPIDASKNQLIPGRNGGTALRGAFTGVYQ